MAAEKSFVSKNKNHTSLTDKIVFFTIFLGYPSIQIKISRFLH